MRGFSKRLGNSKASRKFLTDGREGVIDTASDLGVPGASELKGFKDKVKTKTLFYGGGGGGGALKPAGLTELTKVLRESIKRHVPKKKSVVMPEQTADEIARLIAEDLESPEMVGSGLWDWIRDIPEGIKRVHEAVTTKRSLGDLPEEARIYAELSNDAYEKVAPESVKGWRLVDQSPNGTARAYRSPEQPTRIIVAFRGTASPADVVTDARFVLEKVETDPRFLEAKEFLEKVIKTYGEGSVSVTGHSLGGGIALLLTRQWPDLKGEVFNPALNLQILRTLKPEGIRTHSIEGDAVSGSLALWLKNKLIYKNPRVTGEFGRDKVYQHSMVRFLNGGGVSKEEQVRKLFEEGEMSEEKRVLMEKILSHLQGREERKVRFGGIEEEETDGESKD